MRTSQIGEVAMENEDLMRELNKLAEMHAAGVLSSGQFAQAKALLLTPPDASAGPPPSPPRGANGHPPPAVPAPGYGLPQSGPGLVGQPSGFCPACGQQLRFAGRYCGGCGAALPPHDEPSAGPSTPRDPSPVGGVSTGARVLIFTAHVGEPVPIRRALRDRALLLKNDDPATIADGIRSVCYEDWYMSSPLARAVASDPDLVPELSDMQRTVLEGLALGLTYRQLARGIDLGSVAEHRNRAMSEVHQVGLPHAEHHRARQHQPASRQHRPAAAALERARRRRALAVTCRVRRRRPGSIAPIANDSPSVRDSRSQRPMGSGRPSRGPASLDGLLLPNRTGKSNVAVIIGWHPLGLGLECT